MPVCAAFFLFVFGSAPPGLGELILMFSFLYLVGPFLLGYLAGRQRRHTIGLPLLFLPFLIYLGAIIVYSQVLARSHWIWTYDWLTVLLPLYIAVLAGYAVGFLQKRTKKGN